MDFLYFAIGCPILMRVLRFTMSFIVVNKKWIGYKSVTIVLMTSKGPPKSLMTYQDAFMTSRTLFISGPLPHTTLRDPSVHQYYIQGPHK